MISKVDETTRVYDIVRRFWRTTEAFDAIRGSMPPDGVFLFKGNAYFVSQTIAIRVPIPKKDIQLFVRASPSYREHDGWLPEDEVIKATTQRDHPYQHLGPRPNNYHCLFDGKGATIRQVQSLLEAEEGVRVTLDSDAIRDYASRTTGARGNGDSGYLRFESGDAPCLRFVRTPRKKEPIPAQEGLPLSCDGTFEETCGVSPAAFLYALRFLDKNVQFLVGDGRIKIVDETTGTVVVLSNRSK